MIRRKTRFVQSSFKTEELGAKNSLMQEKTDISKQGNIIKQGKTHSSSKLTHKDGIHSTVAGGGTLFYATINGQDIKLSDNEIDEHLNSSINQVKARIQQIDGLIDQTTSTKDVKVRQQLIQEKEALAKQQAQYTTTLAAIDEDKTKLVAGLLNSAMDGFFKLAIVEKTRKENEKQEKDENHKYQLQADIYAIIKKYGFLDKPENFKTLVENSKDAMRLEKDLSALGMHLKVDDKIDDETVSAITGLLQKNAQALQDYKDKFGVNLVKQL